MLSQAIKNFFLVRGTTEMLMKSLWTGWSKRCSSNNEILQMTDQLCFWVTLQQLTEVYLLILGILRSVPWAGLTVLKGQNMPGKEING